MSIAKKILKYAGLTVDGVGYAGDLKEYTPPTLAMTSEDFRAGGMDGVVSIPMGMDKLTANFVLAGYRSELIALYGLIEGASVQITARGALEDLDGAVTKIAHAMRGNIVEVSPGTWGGGAEASLTFTVDLRYYKETIGDNVTTEVDIENMVRIIGGVDQLAAQRAAIGV